MIPDMNIITGRHAGGRIVPPPPHADGVQLPWDTAVDDAVEVVARARATYGDTFTVRTGDDLYLFTFSPTGVESFYALPEEVASKGLADYLMLKRKLPDEIFDGRRTMPHQLFRKGDVVHYLANLDRALDETVTELGESGEVDLFALTRRLGHRMGLASWGGPGSTQGEAFERLVEAFDTLDGSDSFVHPDAMAAVAASGKAQERAALAVAAEVIGAALDALDEDPALAQGHGLFARIAESWADQQSDVRRTGVAYDVALIHIASMSNLAAALGWALVDLVEHPEELALVLDGDRDLAEQCALETTRVAQRSIMARSVMAPVSFDAGDAVYEVGPGTFIATLLPLLNTQTPGYERWEPTRWSRYRLADPSDLASPQLVTAFGHGKHTCPAQPFSLSAMTAAITHLFGAYEMTQHWKAYPRPVPAQIGGVARADGPCVVSYRART